MTSSVSNTPIIPLTVGELRSRLEQYHDATPVLVDGYEGGFDQFGFRLFRVTPVKNEVWWDGRFEEDDRSGTEVLVLQRMKP